MTTARRLDLFGLSLLVSWLLWIVLASLFTGGAHARVLFLVSASAIVMVAARQLSAVAPLIVPLIVTGLGFALIVSARDELLSGAPLSAPLGYANANAALFVQTSIAGLMIWRGAGRGWLRALGIGAAVAFALIPIITGSKAGVALFAVLIPAALIVEKQIGPRAAVAWCAIFAGVVLTATLTLGATYDAADDRSTWLTRIIDNTLTERRIVLWHEALAMTTQHPVVGVGGGGFAVASPTARRDSDARWAHHEFLQHGSEFGVPAGALMVGVVALAFARLSVVRGASPDSVLPATALAALVAHSSIDFVAHFPAVPLACAGLVATGTRVARDPLGFADQVPRRSDHRPVRRPVRAPNSGSV